MNDNNLNFEQETKFGKISLILKPADEFVELVFQPNEIEHSFKEVYAYLSLVGDKSNIVAFEKAKEIIGQSIIAEKTGIEIYESIIGTLENEGFKIDFDVYEFEDSNE